MSDQRVFAIDADPNVRRWVARHLGERGHAVINYHDLEELENDHQTMGPDIVVVDVDWADDAQLLVEQLFPKKTEIQYIQLVRNHTIDEAIEAFNKENRDCLPVPFSKRALVLAVERAGERRYLIAKNLRTMRRLKKSMEEAETRLSILRADQIAGRQMQQNLLPKSPVIKPPYYVGRKILPSLYLSGDFVNYMPAIDQYFLFYLLDVSGHGASSAFVTVLVRQLMRRLVRRHERTNRAAFGLAPEGFLDRLNTILLDNALDKHLTMFAGSLNLEKEVLRYSVGAQLPMPILIENGKARFLEGKGKPVGLFPDTKWDVQELQLPKKFILIAFSDGILEVLPQKTLEEKEQFLLDNLKDVEADVDAVLPALGVEETDGLPDDIAVFMVARGYHTKEHAEEYKEAPKVSEADNG